MNRCYRAASGRVNPRQPLPEAGLTTPPAGRTLIHHRDYNRRCAAMKPRRDTDLAVYRHVGHLTVPGLFDGRRNRRAGRPTSRPGARSSWPSCRRRSAPGTSTAASRRARCCASSTTRTTTATRCAAGRAPGAGGDGRVDDRPRRVGVLQPGLLQAARRRRPEAGAPGQLLLRPQRPRRRGHRLDRARRRHAGERLPVLRRRLQPRARSTPTRRRPTSPSTCSCPPRSCGASR